ncbi:MAG TPA: hypothetical protein VK557_16685 [Pyrinomonadaceae bacterium]|nr:hypothetical protein [Pyrinomonadaceae bacterium]
MPNFMPNLTSIVAMLLSLVVLGVVVTIDFFYRRELYNRSDPISLSLLGYSFLLVLSDAGINMLRQIRTHQFDGFFLTAAVIYLGSVFGVFQFAKGAHRSFRQAQEKQVRDYLAVLQRTITAPSAVWRALEELGTGTIEPDVFVKNQSKENRRVEYLRLVAELTNASITPEVDQENLLVQDKKIRKVARAGYIIAFLFGLLSTMFFFYVRWHIAQP